MIITLISLIHSGDSPITQDLVMMKDEYFTAYPDSKISFTSPCSPCILQQGSTVFYKSDSHKTKKNVSTNLARGSTFYFHPEQYATLDLALYPDSYIIKDSLVLNPLKESKGCIVKIVNNKVILLKNTPSPLVENAFTALVNQEKPRLTIDCILESQEVICRDPINNISRTIRKGEEIKCVFPTGISFFPLSSPTFILKSFTQFQSNEKHCRLTLVSDTVFLPGNYVTTCFDGIIKIPALKGPIRRKPTELSGEYAFIFDANTVKKYAGSAWVYKNPSDTVITPPFHETFVDEPTPTPNTPNYDFSSYTSTTTRSCTDDITSILTQIQDLHQSIIQAISSLNSIVQQFISSRYN